MDTSLEKKSSFCRLCLTASVVYYSLLKNNGKEMLFSLTGIEINSDYPHSTESCVKCWLNLKRAYHIQQNFVNTEKKFQSSDTPVIEPNFIEPLESDNNESNTDLKPNGDEFELIEATPQLANMNDIFKEENESDTQEEIEGNSDDDGEYPELIYIQTDDDNIVEEKPCICFICAIKCENDIKLYAHINSHYNEPQPCDECSMSLPNIPAYRDHIQTKHPKLFKKPYTCGICSLSFKYMPLYDLHLAAVHPQTAKSNKKRRDISHCNPSISNYKCEECNKVFRNKQSLNTHCKGHIKKACPICGVEITVYNLSKHITNHKAAPAICHLCGITSKNPESLRGHMYYTHSKKRLTCEECGREFKKLYAYKMHIKKEHIGERTFTCDTCGKRFFTNYELNSHIRTTHLKQRPHICKFCNKGFSSRFSMRTHERQHTNEVPYVCEVCGEGFRQNVSLRAHRKSKHNIIESKNAECPICRKMFRDDWALKSHTRSVHD